MTRGDRVTWQGERGTVEGFTSDGLSVVVQLDDGAKVYAPAQLPLLAGITSREDLYPCTVATPACTGRAAQRIVP